MSRAGATVVLLAALAMPAAAGAPRPGEVLRDCAECSEVVVVPAGSFVMGSSGRYKYEKPAHRVTIARPFAMGRYEITFEEWQACVDDGGCEKAPNDHEWGRGRRPVINISWIEATNYAAWLSRRTGHVYRLPSEAEWEYAARAGTTTQYSWGDEVGDGKANCRTCAPIISHETYPVGSYDANPWGLFDVHGNVWEWVEDCWNRTHKGAPDDGTARTGGKCRYRVTKSGSWYYMAHNVRSAYRGKFIGGAFSYGISFRVLRELR
jgi:formylglycine-generating enzyme required for sulfatase activity